MRIASARTATSTNAGAPGPRDRHAGGSRPRRPTRPPAVRSGATAPVPVGRARRLVDKPCGRDQEQGATDATRAPGRLGRSVASGAAASRRDRLGGCPTGRDPAQVEPERAAPGRGPSRGASAPPWSNPRPTGPARSAVDPEAAQPGEHQERPGPRRRRTGARGAEKPAARPRGDGAGRRATAGRGSGGGPAASDRGPDAGSSRLPAAAGTGFGGRLRVTVVTGPTSVTAATPVHREARSVRPAVRRGQRPPGRRFLVNRDAPHLRRD